MGPRQKRGEKGTSEYTEYTEGESEEKPFLTRLILKTALAINRKERKERIERNL